MISLSIHVENALELNFFSQLSHMILKSIYVRAACILYERELRKNKIRVI